MEQLDFLSFSPSLPDILQHLGLKDIENCRLVNRRVHEVIQNNSLRLPRRAIPITIDMNNMARTECVKIGIAKHLVVCAMEGQTILLPYEKGYIRFSVKYTTSNGDMIDGLLGCFENKDAGVSYRNGGINQELHKLFAFLFRKLYISQLKMGLMSRGSFREEWVEIICSEFLRNRSQCEELCARDSLPGLRNLFTSIDSLDTYVTASRFKSLDSVKSISAWNSENYIILEVTESHFGSLEEVSMLIMKWSEGSFSLKNLEVKCSYSSHWWEWPAYCRKVLYSIVTGLKKVTVFEGEEIVKNREYERTIQRNCDNKILVITIDYDETTISLEDYDSTD